MDRKADQISAHFYSKLYYVVHEARESGNGASDGRGGGDIGGISSRRASGEGGATGSGTVKVDKWSSRPRPPPFSVHVVLVLPDLPATQVAVSLPSRVPLPATMKEILLERWSISLSAAPSHTSADGSDDLPTVYKHGIPLFRGAWSLLRVLPAWGIKGRLRRMGARIEVRLVDPEGLDGLDWYGGSGARIHTFPSVPHPRGTLTLRVEYLPNPDFGIDSRESVLSSHMRAGDDDDAYADQSHLSSVNVGLTGLVSSSPLGAGKTSPPTIPHSPLAASSSTSVSPSQQPPPPPPTRKRYSSSFGHRYSPNSGTARPLTPGSGSAHSSYNEKLSSAAAARTDDDDLSDFVQEIDARKPLRRPLPLSSSPPSSTNTTPFPSSSPPKGYPTSTIPYPVASTSNVGLLMRQEQPIGRIVGMTSEEAVDAELGRMNDAFLKSLEGLGSGSTRQSRREAASPTGTLSRQSSLPRREPLSREIPLHRRGVTEGARPRKTSNLSLYEDEGLFNYSQ
ncbi:hypothetical protein BDZ89DRAFT_1159612 [Hymenopellis radicata]|nr:hypothetical protein BDZ89DRAFT_1159612 [Hymenopellis radicata]